MVNIEQRALRALAYDLLARFQGLVEVDRNISDVGSQECGSIEIALRRFSRIKRLHTL